MKYNKNNAPNSAYFQCKISKLLYNCNERIHSPQERKKWNMVGIILSYAITKVALTSVISCELILFFVRKEGARPDFSPSLPATTCLSLVSAEQSSETERAPEKLSLGAQLDHSPFRRSLFQWSLEQPLSLSSPRQRSDAGWQLCSPLFNGVCMGGGNGHPISCFGV